MRFRLGINGGGGGGTDPLVGGVSRGLQTLFMAPMLQAQAADQFQSAEAKRRLMDSEQRAADAHAALYGQQAEAGRRKLDRQTMPEMIRTALMMNQVSPDKIGEATQFFQTGQLPDLYNKPGDGVGPTVPQPDYADTSGLGGRIIQTLGLTRQALTVGDKSVQNIAKASGAYQEQDAKRRVEADPTLAGAVGQAAAAAAGNGLVKNIGNTGETFNQFTGQSAVSSPGLRALFGDVQGANMLRDRAAASASYASAAERNAQAAKVRQDTEQGARTGALQVVTGPNGEVTVVDKVNRTAQPVLGADGKPIVKGAAGGGGKPMTEAQAKANLFGGRMVEADQILNDLEGKYKPWAVSSKLGLENTPMIGGALAAGANMVMSPVNQQAEQAQRDFINAVLRRESGAAISKSEFDNAFKQYFPQPGDSQKVIAQKRRNRQIATTLMLQEVPEALRYKPGSTVPAPTPPAVPVTSSGAEGSWGDAPAGAWSIQRVN